MKIVFIHIKQKKAYKKCANDTKIKKRKKTIEIRICSALLFDNLDVEINRSDFKFAQNLSYDWTIVTLYIIIKKIYYTFFKGIKNNLNSSHEFNIPIVYIRCNPENSKIMVEFVFQLAYFRPCINQCILSIS